MWRWLEVDIEIPVPTHSTASVFMVMGSRATEPACVGTPFPGIAQAVRAREARPALTGAMIY